MLTLCMLLILPVNDGVFYVSSSRAIVSSMYDPKLSLLELETPCFLNIFPGVFYYHPVSQ